MLSTNHFGSLVTNYIDIILPGTLGNDGLYAHGLGGPDTHKNVYADVVLTKKPGDTKVELRFRHLNVSSVSSGSSTGKLLDYFSPVIYEYNILAINGINLIIPEGALVVPGFYTEYQDSLDRPSQSKHFSSNALTIDVESFEGTGLFYSINLYNHGTILGAGGTIAKRRVWSYTGYSGNDLGFGSNPDDHVPYFMPVQRPDGAGRRVVPSIDGGTEYGYNGMGFPYYDIGGLFEQYVDSQGNSQKLGSIGLPTDPILIRGNLSNVMFKLYNKSTGIIYAGGGGGGGGPVEDINLMTSNNDGHWNYCSEAYGQQYVYYSGGMYYYPSYSYGHQGIVHTFPDSSRAPFRPLVGGGFGGFGAGWHYSYGLALDTSGVFYRGTFGDYDNTLAANRTGQDALDSVKDGPLGHHRTSPTNASGDVYMHTWDTAYNGNIGFQKFHQYYPYYTWMSNRRGYEGLGFHGGPTGDGNPYGILNKGSIPANHAEMLTVSDLYNTGPNPSGPSYRFGWDYGYGITGTPNWNNYNPEMPFAGVPGISQGSNFQKNAGYNGLSQTQQLLGGNGASYGQDGTDATSLTHQMDTTSQATIVRSGTGVGGKGGKSITVRWFTVGDSNGLTNQNAHVASSERLGWPYASIVENLGDIQGNSDIQYNI